MPQVTRGYVLDKLPPPAPWKVYLDKAVMPKVIDAVTSVEMGVEHVAVGTRKRSVAALGVGYVLGTALRRRG